MPNQFEVHEQLPSQDVLPLGILFQHVATSPSDGTKLGIANICISVDAPNLEVLIRDKANNDLEGALVELLTLEGDVEQAKYTAPSGIATFNVSAECCLRISCAGKQSQFQPVKINAGGSQFMYALADAVPVIHTNKGTGISLVPSNSQNTLYQIK